MKKLLLILLCLPLLFTTCKKVEDDNNIPTNTTILDEHLYGNWVLTNNYCCHEPDWCTCYQHFSFFSNGNATSWLVYLGNTQFTWFYTWTVEGDQLIISPAPSENSADIEQFTYWVAGSQLHLYDPKYNGPEEYATYIKYE
jgi:hypothetical protein